jgi:hypothetical protein
MQRCRCSPFLSGTPYFVFLPKRVKGINIEPTPAAKKLFDN